MTATHHKSCCVRNWPIFIGFHWLFSCFPVDAVGNSSMHILQQPTISSCIWQGHCRINLYNTIWQCNYKQMAVKPSKICSEWGRVTFFIFKFKMKLAWALSKERTLASPWTSLEEPVAHGSTTRRAHALSRRSRAVMRKRGNRSVSTEF